MKKQKPICFKCLLQIEHPWHDNGTVNERDIKEWYADGKYGAPFWNR